jgi:signal transduction histidine kinase
VLGLATDRLIGQSVSELAPFVAAAARPLVETIARALGDEMPVAGGRLTIEDDPAGAMTVSLAPLRQADGALLGRVFSFRPPRSVREVQAHLRRTGQLASLGAFALGLAHELRNPLGAIKGLAQLLQMREPAGADADCLRRMTAEIDRADRFIGRLLELTDAPGGAPEPVDPARLLREAMARALGRAAAGRRQTIRIEHELQPAPPLLLECERMTQAVEQLAANALAHTPDGGTIRLGCALHSADGQAPARVRMTIHNSGSTIAPENIERIFDPFYTTRDGATGLGLTMAREIAAHNGARMAVRTDAHGVAFTLDFGPERIAEIPGETP